ncbi:phosphodiester glycosidase family protein [Paenibacillus polymyxa]|uniref:phosphodiester glycosidase family protein n=1 Tax=Paenibacillus TaxID=44249 RepID=UPI00057E4957|nr:MULTISPECIES: phosphodiester glycosidase family protein [Paenibacillus]AIY10892.1 copper amine oxidase [Paenibacillus polymyxa]KAF6656155.1 phosphodiester glycosidase family protein [Paenibacillus sp. EKM301P]RPE06200.1 copper amine oxidase [Paenibacillus polymyxa]UBS88830.1 phosphodiester glycosidase family protein [Paenibacillus polymyxa]WHX37518.1 phosphodiester glycosidase family protein [Paenibacillus polymyxa]
MKRITALIILSMLLLVTPIYAAAPTPMLVYVDQSNHSFIPLRLLNSYEGITFHSNPADKKIEIAQGNTRLTLLTGQSTAKVNDQTVRMQNAPFTDNGATYVPLQFISQHLNLQVLWLKENSAVRITQGTTSVTLPVLTGKLPGSTTPITTAHKSFKVGSRAFSAKVVTISMLHPKVSLDVALAGDTLGKVENLSSLAKRNQAVVAINGTFFDAYTKSSYKTPYGYLVSHGKMLKKSSGDQRTVFTYDANHLAELVSGSAFEQRLTTQGSVEGALQAGPRLVTNGQVSLNVKAEGFKDPKILTGGGARSALGITRDHKLILLTTSGATIPQLAQMMKQAGAYQAMNLDGGASSGLYYNGSYLTTPGRQISNAIIVKYQ